MIFLKSFLAGASGLLGYLVLLAAWFDFQWRSPDGAVYFGSISGRSLLPILLGAFLFFAMAFAWGFRRFSR
jgi:hypothetical protein